MLTTYSTGALSPCLFFVPGAGFCAYVPAVTGPTFQFNPEGTAAIPFDSGRYSSGSFPIFGLPRQGGDQYATGNYDGTTLRPSIEKLSTLARVEFEASSAITVSLEGSYARSEAVNPNATGAVGPFPFLLFDPFLLGYQIAPEYCSQCRSTGPWPVSVARSVVRQSFWLTSRVTPSETTIAESPPGPSVIEVST